MTPDPQSNDFQIRQIGILDRATVAVTAWQDRIRSRCVTDSSVQRTALDDAAFDIGNRMRNDERLRVDGARDRFDPADLRAGCTRTGCAAHAAHAAVALADRPPPEFSHDPVADTSSGDR